MPDTKRTAQDSDSGYVTPGGNTRDTSQAEGGEHPGETDRKVGRTPGQAEGTRSPDEQNEK